MSKNTGDLVSVKIIPNEKGSPPGKLADAEVIFEADAGGGAHRPPPGTVLPICSEDGSPFRIQLIK